MRCQDEASPLDSVSQASLDVPAKSKEGHIQQSSLWLPGTWACTEGRQLKSQFIFGHLSRLGERSVVVVAGDVWHIARSCLHPVEAENVGPVHVAKVGSPVEHVEVHAAVRCKDVSKNFTEIRFRKSVVVLLKPVVEPAWPKLGDQNR